MFLKILSILARLGAFTASVIVIGIAGDILKHAAWIKHFLIYVEVIGAFSVLAAFIPPYPNFLLDGFFAAAWLVSAAFMLLETVSVSAACWRHGANGVLVH
jgi:hypothetical protein